MEQNKGPRRGGSVTLPKGASEKDVDDALRGPAKPAKPAKEKEAE